METEIDPYPPQIRPVLNWPEEVSAQCRSEIEAILVRAGHDGDFMEPDVRLAVKDVLIARGVAESMADFDMRAPAPQGCVDVTRTQLLSDSGIGALLAAYRVRWQSARQKLKDEAGPHMLAAFPAYEAVPWGPAERAAVEQRWLLAGGLFYDGRMIAAKTSPVWNRMDAISPPGLPSLGLPPFLLGWHSVWAAIGWDEAFLLGVEAEGIPQLMLERTPERLNKAQRSVDRYRQILADGRAVADADYREKEAQFIPLPVG